MDRDGGEGGGLRRRMTTSNLNEIFFKHNLIVNLIQISNMGREKFVDKFPSYKMFFYI